MFEKEAEEYWYDSGSNEFDIGQVEKACKQSFKDGAEFGYNKAKEEAKDIINELLINGYDERTREKALNFLYPDKEESE